MSNACSRCGAPAQMQCPTCLQKGLPATYFCNNDCFKAAWKTHKAAHDPSPAEAKSSECPAEAARKAPMSEQEANFVPPPFNYTGPLRPHYVTPMREVPAHIRRPEYALTGVPNPRSRSLKVDVKTPEEIAGIRAASRLGRDALDMAGAMVRPGVTTDEIDRAVHDFIVERGGYPSTLNYRGFPKSCCISVNEVICHGIPDRRELQDGDIVNVDITAYFEGYHGDLNETFCCGSVDEQSKALIRTTYESLMHAIDIVRPGTLYREVGNVIHKHVAKHGFSVVRSFCGHGIGTEFHCAPSIPHYANNKAVGVMKAGQVFTIEPMINAGTWRDVLWPDDWTAVTADGKRSAQFEHTLLVTETGCEILTARTPRSVPLWWESESPNGDAKASSSASSSQSQSTPQQQQQQQQQPAAAKSNGTSKSGKGGEKKRK